MTFLPDVIVGCCLLHNFLLRQSVKAVETLIDVLHNEEMVVAVMTDRGLDVTSEGLPTTAPEEADAKKTTLAAFLATKQMYQH